MTQLSAKQQPSSTRATDPNVLQRMASNPQASVWVGASAGSGKTKVLTDRMLRLMLPDSKGKAETQPHKILALTFTKAGASEMALRINQRLSEWAVIPPEELRENLKNLLGGEPTKEQTDAARKLFAFVVDTPGGLKIMTIHSFCQSILGRFPLEAGLPPNFKPLEEAQAQSLLNRARNRVFEKAKNEKGSPLYDALQNLTRTQNEEQFDSLLNNLMSERNQLRKILEKNFGVDGLYTALCQQFDIPAGQSEEECIFNACQNGEFDAESLRKACKSLAEGGGVKDLERSISIQNWLDAAPKNRVTIYSNYKLAYLTKTDETVIKNLAVKAAQKIYPNILDVLQKEAQRILSVESTIKKISTAALTRDLFLIGEEILTEYGALKKSKNALDFDDLILRTLDLLKGETKSLKGLESAPWIRFKLDQGVDHILVDEAQDTNPEQWEIVQALSDDFFDGNDEDRTIFVVGDDKQSIFSFQRASPEKFHTMKEWFGEKISNSKKKFEPVDFNISFRSVPAILQLVDTVFDNLDIHQSKTKEVVQHQSYRAKQAGLVEFWPLFENPEKEDFDPWAPPIDIIDSTSGAAQMAAHVGNTIAEWIDKKEILQSHDRAIEPGDIMILVRSRTAFLDQLVRALKTRNIPVSGVDRMVLSEQLVVQDLCAAAQFSLLPSDDLTLAGLLKSPFIGWSEEQIFDVSHSRKGTLWTSVKESGHQNTIAWLTELIKLSGHLRPYDFFSHLLQEKCPANNLSGLHAIKSRLGEECLDPLDEFLNVALSFEKDNTPTLQGFLQAQQNDESQIKRQMEESSHAVHIMTAHGAKGLQAPIVILPDTVRTGSSNKPERLLWPDRTGHNLPYFCPQSKQVPDQCADALAAINDMQDKEYRRLLYVALTRAEDRLYIGGYKASKDPIDDSWYRYIETGFKNLPDVKETETEIGKILQFSNVATDKADRIHKNKPATKSPEVVPPDWLFKPMPEEPFPPRPLMPSRPSGKENPAISPLKAEDNQRFVRGNVTHKLLQILPDLAVDKREAAARKYTALAAHKLNKDIQQDIVKETMDILNDPKFSAVFDKGSLAEVSITGQLKDKTPVSGQIDRLVVTANEVLIIDYKTNRPPPKRPEDVPEIYYNQLRAYREIIEKIYPNRPVKTALIWTDGPNLMEIET